MYSLEDRIKAVQLYIDSGCDVFGVIRTLGYPSPNALRQWYTEYTQTGKLHQKLSRTPRYTPDQIEAAVAYYAKHRGGLIGTVRALGYPDRNTLSQWVRAAHPEEIEKTVRYCKSGHKLVRCTQEQKQAAVESWIRGTPDYKVAAQYGVCKATVYVWKKKLLGEESAGM